MEKQCFGLLFNHVRGCEVPDEAFRSRHALKHAANGMEARLMYDDHQLAFVSKEATLEKGAR